MKNKHNNKILFSLIIVLIATWVVAFIYEPKLPQQIPTHWNSKGEINGYTEKPWGVLIIPVISTVMSLLLMLLPKIAPKGFKLTTAKTIYDTLVLVIAVFMLGVMVLMFEAGLNKDIDINQWVMVSVGALFLVIGNYLSKVPKNFFLGIRTPWTLSSDEVWYKTHRMGSWVFVVCGLLTIIGALMNWHSMVLIVILALSAILPVLYSLVVYKRIEGFHE